MFWRLRGSFSRSGSLDASKGFWGSSTLGEGLVSAGETFGAGGGWEGLSELLPKGQTMMVVVMGCAVNVMLFRCELVRSG